MEVAESGGGNGGWQCGVSGLCGEDPPEIVRGEPQRRPVDVSDARGSSEVAEHAADPPGGEHLLLAEADALEQVRQRRSPGAPVDVITGQPPAPPRVLPDPAADA